MGIDIGGTTIKAGLINDSKIIIKKEISTPDDKREFQNRIIEITSELTTFSKEKLKKLPKFIGIGSPGPSDYFHGIININNRELKNINLTKILKPFNKKIIINNDANVFTLYHSILGPGEKYSIVCGLTLGTGIGTGLIIDRSIYLGRGNAIEYGHVLYKENSSYEQEYRKIIKESKEKLKVDSTLDIFLKAKEGNTTAIETFSRIGNLIGSMIIGLIYAYDPEIVIIGGKVANSWPFLKKPILSKIKNRSILRKTKIVKNTRAYAGLIGTSLLNSTTNIR